MTGIPWLAAERYHADEDAKGNRPFSKIEPARLLALIQIAESVDQYFGDHEPMAGMSLYSIQSHLKMAREVP